MVTSKISLPRYVYHIMIINNDFSQILSEFCYDIGHKIVDLL